MFYLGVAWWKLLTVHTLSRKIKKEVHVTDSLACPYRLRVWLIFYEKESAIDFSFQWILPLLFLCLILLVTNSSLITPTLMNPHRSRLASQVAKIDYSRAASSV